MTPRYCEADPFEGGKQAVAEAWRNLTAVGAKPLALTDNLNFGNPERPEIMGQLVGCIQGHRGGLQGARLPGRVRQRVALQRDQRPRDPADADDRRRRPARRFRQVRDASPSRRPDEVIVLLGETKGWLGQSLYLREICGREEGAPPPVDLDGRAARRRFRARPDRARASSPRCTTSPTAGCWSRSPRWRCRRASARELDGRAGVPDRAWLLVRRGPGALCGDDQAGAVRRARGARRRRPACRSGASA